jgi:hypothetical protein
VRTAGEIAARVLPTLAHDCAGAGGAAGAAGAQPGEARP